MSQTKLAKTLSAAPRAIGRFKRDKVKPSIEVAVKIAKVLGVSLDYLTENSTVNPLKNKNHLSGLTRLLILKIKTGNTSYLL